MSHKKLHDHTSSEEEDYGTKYNLYHKVADDVNTYRLEDSDTESDTGLQAQPLHSASYRHKQRGSSSMQDENSPHQASLHSFGTAESISTIRDHTSQAGGTDMSKVYEELQLINDKMKREFALLHERGLLLKEKEDRLQEREQILSEDKQQYEDIVVAEVKRRMQHKEQEHLLATERQEFQLKEKSREHKRLKENFETLKAANDTLRKELESIQLQYSKLEKTTSSLQARLNNLQRRREQGEVKEEDFLPADLVKRRSQQKAEQSRDVTKPRSSAKCSCCSGVYEVLAVLLEWISEVNLRHAITDQPTKPLEGFNSKHFLHDKCFKVMPSLVEILREVGTSQQSLMLPCVQFTYWSLLQMGNHQTARTSLSSTLRRLGEELYRPRGAVKSTDEGCLAAGQSSNKECLYFRSANLHIRFLSSLVILQTITQVDHVAHVFEVLKTDLKCESAKELFLHYQATPVFLPYVKPSSRQFSNAALDIYLHMTVDSQVLSSFLQSCSNEAWFRPVTMLFRMPNAEEKLLEKISIILQKLSKLKCNRKFFEVFGLTVACQELVRSLGTKNAFLSLNLKSIIFNLQARPASSSVHAAPASPACSTLANQSLAESTATIS